MSKWVMNAIFVHSPPRPLCHQCRPKDETVMTTFAIIVLFVGLVIAGAVVLRKTVFRD
jgi:hypothetical protein